MSNKTIQIRINNFLDNEKLYFNTLYLYVFNHLIKFKFLITLIAYIIFQQVNLKKIPTADTGSLIFSFLL
jgi:hypothetical protein